MALGDLEREIMTVLWETYLPMTVREVHQELARERHRVDGTALVEYDQCHIAAAEHRDAKLRAAGHDEPALETGRLRLR